jgi:23S rRNA (cytosine1962-C5)-methyltransferase
MPAKEKSQTRGGKSLPASERAALGRKPDGPFAMISRRAADRLRGGHVWVYQSDVERVIAPTGDSGLIAVVDSRGAPLGTALYSANSQIALRLVSGGAIDASAWLKLLRERLRAAIALRKPILAMEDTDACRLVFSEADFLPGMIADKYGDLVILQLLTRGMDVSVVRSAFVEVVVEEIGPRAVFERADARIREIEQLGAAVDGPVYTRDDGTEESSATIFHLNGLRLQYDANAGQKTGAFLDQRENYAAAARHCWGEALDVCTYQGGFALHLAQVCERVTGVDASRAALEVAESNLALNREPLGSVEVDWVEANAFDLLRDWSDSGKKFDSIVLDPPAFAKSKRAAEGALRGYKELNLRALKMLRPGGTLVTCSCSHHVGVADFTAVVAAAAGDARRQVRLVERRSAAVDHPVLLTVPETEYLKCLICRVD